MRLHVTGKLPFAYLLLAFFLGSLLTYSWVYGKSPIPVPARCSATNQHGIPCDYVITRVKGYEFIRPLLSAEPQCESTALKSFKPELMAILDSLKQTGAIADASIYLREFKYGEWIAINPGAQYHPASLLKVGLLLTYLRLAEANPGLLTQKIVYEKPQEATITPQYYTFPTLEPGKAYTVHELLYYLVAYSDNNASWLLASRLDPAQSKKMFFDLGLPDPVLDKDKFAMTAEEVSVFFKAIINASYLSPEYSEYAARLLSNCAFKDGLAGGMPANTPVWHKFGEWRGADSICELHEAGVLYIGETPFLLTIMTRGADTDQLAGSIRVLSKAIYTQLRHTNALHQ